jgi:DNA-binding CsgD family transcriptional regulator
MEAVMRATGSDLAPHVRVALLAWQGREAEASELIEATLRQVVTRGDRLGVTIVQGAAALLYNGLGRYEDALAAVEQAAEYPELGGTNAAVIELIEAAARSGKAGLAADALERLSETTRTSGTEWALGTEAASRALLSDGQVAEDLYREAIERLGRSRAGVYLARAHLLYGEWLRRQRRRVDAREELRTAREMFTTMGIEGFAQRAERELLATGETARKRTAETRDHLTPQETQIAQLARDGHSNPQIGSQLFISPRTVEYHLHKVFGKLNINSRNQLDRVLSGGPDALQAA